MQAKYSQREVIDGLGRGETWAANALYGIVIAPIRAATRRTASSHSDYREDLVQQSFERLLLSLRRGQFEGRTTLESWAWLIATRVAVDFLRRRVRERSVHKLVDPDAPEVVNLATGMDLDLTLQHRADVHRVQRALAELSPAYSNALDMDLRGYYSNEVGDILGITAAAAQTRLSRARKALTQAMGQQSAGAV
ncbi:MAG: hypothetical protein RJA70_954 [Pseudomonadota bacterium]|jgi:RNA polymerase sigma-70 factor (ECF subfamily)